MNRWAIVIAVFLLSTLSVAHAQLSNEEKQALADMIIAWPSLTTAAGPWGDPEIDDPCTGWNGLDCDINDHITSFAPDVSLSGPIPNSISGLTWLQNLQFPGKSVSGTLPALISNITTLVNVDLSNNQLEGPLPDFTGALGLRVLRASNNMLNGSIPNYDLPDLEVLALAGNKFDGFIPDIGTLFPVLKQCILSSNELSGGLPSIGSLEYLEILNVAFNQLSGTINVLPQTLLELHAENNTFTSLASDVFSLSIYIAKVDLANNDLSVSVASLFTQLSSLTELDLSSNQIQSGLPLFTGSPLVQSLNLANNDFGGQVPVSYVSLPNLATFDASNNALVGSVPAFSGTILTELKLSRNALTGSLPNSLTDLTSLNKLYLDHNSLDGTIPMGLNSSSMNFIHLENNDFTGPLPIWNFTITELYLNDNRFELCDDPFPIIVAFCDVSSQRITICGCNMTTFYNRCISDEILEECPPLDMPIAAPVEPDSPPVSAPEISTVPVSSSTPIAAPVAVPEAFIPIGGCVDDAKPGFECRGGVWYADSFTGTGDMVFEDPVIIGTGPSDTASFPIGSYSFLSTLTVRGTITVGQDATLTFTGIDFGTKRNPAIPRLTANCASISGTLAISLTSDDLNSANGRLVALYRTNCGVGTFPTIRINKPASDCRTVGFTPSTSSGPPYTVRASLIVSSAACAPENNNELPNAPAKKSSNWWVGLLVALIVIAVLIIAVVLIAIFVPSVRAKVYPIFAKTKPIRADTGSNEPDHDDSSHPHFGANATSATPMAAIAMDESSLGSQSSESSSQQESSEDEGSEEAREDEDSE